MGGVLQSQRRSRMHVETVELHLKPTDTQSSHSISGLIQMVITILHQAYCHGNLHHALLFRLPLPVRTIPASISYIPPQSLPALPSSLPFACSRANQSPAMQRPGPPACMFSTNKGICKEKQTSAAEVPRCVLSGAQCVLARTGKIRS
jgi:hypothetical protein